MQTFFFGRNQPYARQDTRQGGCTICSRGGLPVEDIAAQAAFTCEIIDYYETVEPNCARRRWKKFFRKVLIKRLWRFDSPVFCFYILSVKGVVKESRRPTVSDVFLRGI